MREFEVGETVRINTPGESHHKRTGTVLVAPRSTRGPLRVLVDLGDVQWYYWPKELLKETK